jgi:hypothetical protein
LFLLAALTTLRICSPDACQASGFLHFRSWKYLAVVGGPEGSPLDKLFRVVAARWRDCANGEEEP